MACLLMLISKEKEGDMRNRGRNWMHDMLLNEISIANMINGGISQSNFQVINQLDHLLIKVTIPGVKIDHIEVQVLNKQVLVHHKMKLKNGLNIMRLVATIVVTKGIDYSKISSQETNGYLMITLPFNDKSFGFGKNINIE